MKRVVAVLLCIAACRADAPVHITERWRWVAPAPAYAGAPVSDGNAVFATYGHSHLVRLDGGRLVWDSRLVGLRDLAPTVAGDVVLAATDLGVAAFAVGDGSLLWHRELGDAASRPVIAGDDVVVTTWEGRVVMLDRWDVELPGPSPGPPAVAGGVVVASWDTGVSAIDAGSGSVLWQRDFGGDTSAAAVFDDVAVVVGGDRRIHALELRTGSERWSVRASGAGSGEAPPAVAGGMLAAADRLGQLVVVDRRGRVRWRADGDGAVVRSGPVWIGDAVVLPLDDGRLMAARPGETSFRDPPGRVSGVGSRGKAFVVATREAATNGLYEFRIG